MSESIRPAVTASVAENIPADKNVKFSREAQTKQTGSGRGFTFESTPPERWTSGVIEDRAELEDLLTDVSIRYVASTLGLSNGDFISYVENSGTDPGYDLRNTFTDTTTKPTFNTSDAANPFPTGAMKFVTFAGSVILGDPYESDYFEFSSEALDIQTLAPTGAFTMYFVMSHNSAVAKNGNFPLYVQGTIGSSNQRAEKSFAYFVSTGSPDFLRVRLSGNQYTSIDVDALANVAITGDVNYDATSDNSKAVVIVVTVDDNGKTKAYNQRAKASSEDTFPSGRSWKAETFGGPSARDELQPESGSTGDTSYVAEFGYWNKKIDSQDAATIARLLADKYQIS